MSAYFDAFKIGAQPKTDEKYVITLDKTRISVLSDCLIRVERSVNEKFLDKATQSVWFRNFCNPEFTHRIIDKTIVIKTSKVEFIYSTKNDKMVQITLADGRVVTDFKKGNLKGTKRTLDQSFGKVKLGDGIISMNGVAVLDDSNSLVVEEYSDIHPRSEAERDIYFFAYGYDYEGAVRDLFKLTGYPPLVPKFALGNWWSRYKAYTQDEYITLMQRFIDEEIPITVATVDMDWHWTDVEDRFGKTANPKYKGDNYMQRFYDRNFKGGWTGYSWNTELFPDPDGFLKWLQDRNFKVTLNLHPASGVRWFEDNYSDFARFMGDKPEDKKHYLFDITDKAFVEAYFRFLHKPMQDKGVDFWWIDWQQGNKTKIPGLDPLWALNHFHSMDIARDGKRRPLILSRFAGAGSQRYPLGFSGDTAQNWAVLDFQPYFTSTASNIGYTWWSHDIGGHHFGKKDDELYTRWVQFGTFSPIMRLHSTSNEFLGKEPWKYSGATQKIAVEFLRLRHRLLPYLYTMNYRTAFDGVSLCEPMYYKNPQDKDAYSCKNEYWFGSEMIACPITEKASRHTLLAGVDVWLPNGRYTDIFTGRIYQGGRKYRLYRDSLSFPVLAKEGAVIPLGVNDRSNDISNPKDLEILVYRGNNSFSMYEDDGETMDYRSGKYAFTNFEVRENGNTVEFTIEKVSGDTAVVPSERNYTLNFKDVKKARISVLLNGVKYNNFTDETTFLNTEVSLKNIKPTDKITVILEDVEVTQNKAKRELLIDTISKFQGANNPKKAKYTAYVNGKKDMPALPEYFKGPLKEIENMYESR